MSPGRRPRRTTAQLGGVGLWQALVAAFSGEVEDRRGTEAAVEVLVEEHLGGLAEDLVVEGAVELMHLSVGPSPVEFAPAVVSSSAPSGLPPLRRRDRSQSSHRPKPHGHRPPRPLPDRALQLGLRPRAAAGRSSCGSRTRTGPGAPPRARRRSSMGSGGWGSTGTRGPGSAGPHEPYRQSERSEGHERVAAQVLESGHGYRCFCTP